MAAGRYNPLLEVLRDPFAAKGFEADDWNLLLRQAKREKLVARLGYLLEDNGLTESAPPRVLDTIRAARAYVHFHQVQIRREVHRLARALRGMDAEPILLKGAAYLEAGLPHARGRRMADIDVLIPKDKIPAVERRLIRQGWEPQQLNAYDQRYYREWMHEIPPLKHPERGIEVDIHHALLPLTARVRPDPELLRVTSRALAGGPYLILSPTDMVLHSAAQIFYDGEIAGDLRGLIDLHEMLGAFGGDSDFWALLLVRARCLELGRPLFYALRYCTRLLRTPVPAQTMAEAQEHGPPAAVERLMDLLVDATLMPSLPDETGAPLSAWLLYARSHWLRMPPWLLARHLTRKAWRRARGAQSESV